MSEVFACLFFIAATGMASLILHIIHATMNIGLDLLFFVFCFPFFPSEWTWVGNGPTTTSRERTGHIDEQGKGGGVDVFHKVRNISNDGLMSFFFFSSTPFRLVCKTTTRAHKHKRERRREGDTIVNERSSCNDPQLLLREKEREKSFFPALLPRLGYANTPSSSFPTVFHHQEPWRGPAGNVLHSWGSSCHFLWPWLRKSFEKGQPLLWGSSFSFFYVCCFLPSHLA